MKRPVRLSALATALLVLSLAPACVREAPPTAAVAQAQADAAGVAPALAHPKEALRLFNLVKDPTAEGWAAAVALLGDQGGPFARQHLTDLRAAAEGEAAAAYDAALARLDERLAADVRPSAAAVVPLLERAAYADLMCDPMEDGLPAWTFAYLGAHRDDPDLRAELERVAEGYAPTYQLETLFSTMDERVPEYARKVLAGAAPGPLVR